MQYRKVALEPKRPRLFQAWAKPEAEGNPHIADQHVGRQIATVRAQSDVSQAQLPRSIGISFEGLPGNDETSRDAPPLPGDGRIDFIASAEGRRLIEGLMRLHPRVRNRVSALIAALGEELASLVPEQDSERAGEPETAERKTS